MTLIERLEAATEGSRELDAEIWETLGGKIEIRYASKGPEGHVEQKRWIDKDGTWWQTSLGTQTHFSTSLDAALTLAPEGWIWEVSNGYAAIAPVGWADHHGEVANDVGGSEANGNTAALALCIAALKARQ